MFSKFKMMEPYWEILRLEREEAVIMPKLERSSGLCDLQGGRSLVSHLGVTLL